MILPKDEIKRGVLALTLGAITATVMVGPINQVRAAYNEYNTPVVEAEMPAQVVNLGYIEASPVVETPKIQNVNYYNDYYTAYYENYEAPKGEKQLLAEQASLIDIETEQLNYFKDGTLHDAITMESQYEVCKFVTDIELGGKKVFPHIDPTLLMGQQMVESGRIIDATSGSNGKGNQVGLSQSSCKWNFDNVNKWAFIVGENPVETKEEARELLIKYPLLNTVVQAQQLEDYYSSMHYGTDEDKTNYALLAYRYGPNDISNDSENYVGKVASRQAEAQSFVYTLDDVER